MKPAKPQGRFANCWLCGQPDRDYDMRPVWIHQDELFTKVAKGKARLSVYALVFQSITREMGVPPRGKVGSRANRLRRTLLPKVAAETKRRLHEKGLM